MSLFCAVALSFAPVGSTITVDDDGPADFPTIAEAIAAAAPGDIVLVAAGNYGPFFLDRRLRILGATGTARPRVGGLSVLASAAGFVVAGLDFRDAAVQQVHAHAILDDCSFGVFVESASSAALTISACDQLEVSRCTATGMTGIGVLPGQAGRPGMLIEISRVMLVDCAVRGGAGYHPTGGGHQSGGDGGCAVVLRKFSSVSIIGVRYVVGGAAGLGSCGLGTCDSDGTAGGGVCAINSDLTLRGVPEDVIAGGNFWFEYGGDPGPPLQLIHSRAAVSGVTLELGAFLPGPQPPLIVADFDSFIAQSNPAEPFLEIGGEDGPGAVRRIKLHGPVGASAVLFASPTPEPTALAGLAAPLWLGLGASLVALPLATQGQEVPVVLPIPIPPVPAAFAITLHAQAVFPGLHDALYPTLTLVSNPANLVPRP